MFPAADCLVEGRWKEERWPEGAGLEAPDAAEVIYFAIWGV